jgi:hypothetical protein
MNQEIKINDTYSISRDPHNWTLSTTRMGINKETKEPKLQTTKTWYGNLEQCIGAIVDRAAGECDNLEELYQMLQDAREGILKAIK